MQLRWVLILLAVLFAFGCAGNGDTDGLLFRGTETFTPAGGGQIDAGFYGARVSASANTFVRNETLDLELHPTSLVEERQGFMHSRYGMRIRFNPDSLSGNGSLLVRLQHEGPYDPTQTSVGVMTDTRHLLMLPTMATEDGVEGVLDAQTVALLTPVTLQPGSDLELTVFTANRETPGASPPPLIVNVSRYQNGAFTSAVPDLTGKRVALCVHGVDSSLSDLVALGQYLLDFKLQGQTVPHYDYVIGFQYTSNNPIATIGSEMATFLMPMIADAQIVDLFAHSMGNLVSRYALESASLGTNRLGTVIHNYISLGGPHEGVPFANVPMFNTLLYIFGSTSYFCLIDLVTDGKGGAPTTSFLTNLNTTTQGPDFDTAKYFTMSGSNYSAYTQFGLPVGDIVNKMYELSVGPNTVQDGLVAVYSAQGTVLEKQSNSWVVGPTLPLSHAGIHEDPTALAQIGAWINSWNQ